MALDLALGYDIWHFFPQLNTHHTLDIEMLGS